MIKREIVFDDPNGNAIVWCQNNEGAEITCISGDKEMYYKPDDMFTFHYEPDKLLDEVVFREIMNSMNISDGDRNNIRKYIKELITELWNEFRK